MVVIAADLRGSSLAYGIDAQAGEPGVAPRGDAVGRLVDVGVIAVVGAVQAAWLATLALLLLRLAH